MLKLIKGGEKITALIISIFFLLFYIYFQSSSIYGGDAGDLVTAAYLHGVPHPPGYPLYTLTGWILTKLSVSTVAWRVTLLSSIPAALTLGILYLICHKITKSSLPAVIAVFSLGFSYLYWLYASVPEVFALLNLFAVVIFWLFLKFRETGHSQYFLIGAFFLGLALTHHHLIIFLTPVYVYMVYPALKKSKSVKKTLLMSFIAGGLGLFSYSYVYFTARSQPAINWENPVTLTGFLRLVTRAIYGTFRSSQGLGLTPLERISALKNYGETLLIDFTGIGIILVAGGILVLFFRQRLIFIITLMAFLLSGPIFVFYASFPIISDFTLATSERFFMVSYLFITVWIACGIQIIGKQLDLRLKKIAPHNFISSQIIFGLIPLTLFYANLQHLQSLRNDRTAELLAEDIFKSTPDQALLLLYKDTTLFDSEYLYFTGGGRSRWRDIKLIHAGMLSFDFYLDMLKYLYPDIDFSSIRTAAGQVSLTALADKYLEIYPIVSDVVLPVDGNNYGWLPQGLVYQLYNLNKNLSPSDIIIYSQKIEPLLASYQNPLSGALKDYKHTMLSDVPKIYADAYTEVGKAFLSATEYRSAEKYFRKSIEYVPQNYDYKLPLAEALLGQNSCRDAESVLLYYVSQIRTNAYPYKLLVRLYKECLKDAQKVNEFETKYNEILKEKQIPLSEF